MGASKRVCPNCGRKMKQQFIGLFHCKRGTSWRRDIGIFERTPDMVFSLERKKSEIKSNSCRRYIISKQDHQSLFGWWSFCGQSSFLLSGFHFHEPSTELR